MLSAARECISTIWNYADDISTGLFIVAVVVGAYLWLGGVLPVLVRLGTLRTRQIAIFAKGDAAGSLLTLFTDAKLFRAKSINVISRAADFGRADKATIFIVHWPDWQAELASIIARTSDQTPLIIYAPQSGDRLSAAAVELLDQHRHVVVTNFRGRLLNDVVSSFITTAYEKR